MSAYAGGKFKQEMPPPGGFDSIDIKRIPAQRIIGYKSFFIASTMLTAYGFFYYQRRQIYLRRLEIDRKEHQIAIYPLALAETDRAFLRQLRHNRHVERDLMKNVPDWKVGTLWGSPVFYNQPEDKLPNIGIHEFYAHRDTWNMRHPVRPNWDVGFENTTD